MNSYPVEDSPLVFVFHHNVTDQLVKPGAVSGPRQNVTIDSPHARSSARFSAVSLSQAERRQVSVGHQHVTELPDSAMQTFQSAHTHAHTRALSGQTRRVRAGRTDSLVLLESLTQTQLSQLSPEDPPVHASSTSVNSGHYSSPTNHSSLVEITPLDCSWFFSPPLCERGPAPTIPLIGLVLGTTRDDWLVLGNNIRLGQSEAE